MISPAYTSGIDWNAVEFARAVNLTGLSCSRRTFGNLWPTHSGTSVGGVWRTLNSEDSTNILRLVKDAITIHKVIANDTQPIHNQVIRGGVPSVVDLGLHENFSHVCNIWVSVSSHFVLVQVDHNKLSAYKSGVHHFALQLPTCSEPQPFYACYKSSLPRLSPSILKETSTHLKTSRNHSKVIAEWLVGSTMRRLQPDHSIINIFYCSVGHLYHHIQNNTWSFGDEPLIKVSTSDVIREIIIQYLQLVSSLNAFPPGLLPLVSAYVYNS